MSVILGFIVSHWLHALIGGGVSLALGIGARALGWPMLLKYWKDILAAIVFGVAVGFAVFFYIELERSRADLATSLSNFNVLQGQAQIVNNDNLSLLKQLQDQSDSIAETQKAGFAAQALAKLALLDAQAQSKKDAGTIAKLKARSTQNHGSCDDEIAVLRSGV